MADLLSHIQKIDKVTEYVIAQEKHKDGNKHFHAYVKYAEGVKLKDAPDAFTVEGCKSGNYQPARSAKAVVKYCTKEEDYISSFDVSSYLSKKRKLSVETIRNKSAKRALEDGDITIQSIRNYNLARSILCEPYEHDDVRGLWIYGPPGTGKSHIARETYPDIYLKQQNKWFDGYNGEEAILLDDLDTPALGHHLKIWADKYACTGELKGGQCQLRHKVFIVTSNYHPEQLFVDKEGNPQYILVEAICRRFKVIEKLTKKQGLEEKKQPENMSVSPNFNLPE